MKRLHTITVTEDEVECLKLETRGYHPLGGLGARLRDNEDGICDASRKLILGAAAKDRHVEWRTPQWLIAIWEVGGGWGGRGTLLWVCEGGMGHAVSVRGTTPEDVLDQILDFHACGPNRNLAEGKGFPPEGDEE
jgi:hypothetical protein